MMFENKKIFILGFARSGYDASKLLAKRGNQVVINDGKDEESHEQDKIRELKELGVQFFFGGHPDELLDSSYDFLIKNPGVPIDHKYIVKANLLGIPVINEAEMAFRILSNEKRFKLVAITGTNGKTTTTTLIYRFLSAFRDGVHLTGNIGYPLSGFIDDIKDDDIVVMETSCQQLENLDMFRPDIAVLTNISEAHLEFMKTYEHYTYVKSKIFNRQTSRDVAIINMGDNESLRITRNIKATTKYFSSKSPINGCYIKDNAIYYYSDMVVLLSDIKLRGVHNYENIMAAIMVAKEFNVSNDVIREVLSNFLGVEHRLEFVDEINGVKYYNDTESTNIKCTKIALSSFNEKTILLLGGYERNQDFNDLKDYCSNVKAIVAIGECRDRVKQFGDSIGIKTVVCEHLKEAFNECVKLSSPGDVVLLSPASASWDQYKQCEDRGDEFKNYVKKLSEKGDNE